MLTSSVCSAGVIVSGSTYDAYDAAFEDVEALDSAGKLDWGSGYSSGTYLGKGWVLTAAHVANISAEFTFTLNGATYTSSAVHIYDGWAGDSASGGDIALIRLEESNVPAQRVLLYSGTPGGLLDEVAVISGYGRTGTGQTGATEPGGVLLHAGQNLIEKTGGSVAFFADYDESILFFDFDDPSASDDGYFWSENEALTYEYMIAAGDSGGGSFVFLDGEYVLGGVNSFIIATDGAVDSSYSDIGALTSVGEFTDWVFEVTGTKRAEILLPQRQIGAVNQAIVVPVPHGEGIVVVPQWIIVLLPDGQVG